MLCDYTAGYISGVISLLVGHPFDTIKIQQQIRGISYKEASIRIKKYRGWTGYYRGLLMPLISNGALNSLFFGIYGDSRDRIVNSRGRKEGLSYNDDATLTEKFYAGCIAGLLSVVVTNPMELVKTKLQSQMKRTLFKGPGDCIAKIYKESGIRGFYRGIVPLIWRDCPTGGVYLVVYESFKIAIPTEEDSYKRIGVECMGGGFAGIASWATVLPFDVVKSRMQADHHKRPHYKGTVHCFEEIIKKEGWPGLYRGFWSCATRAFPVNAIIFVVYEYVLKLCSS